MQVHQKIGIAVKRFTPIGNNRVKFTGKYNGSLYVIDSLHINDPNSSYLGLFGYIKQASLMVSV